MTSDRYAAARRQANALMTYANQIDPLVQANEAALDVWHYRLGGVNFDQAKQVIVEYYANQRAGEKTPITPREVYRQIETRRRQALGPRYYCQAHEGQPRDRCRECRREILDGSRMPEEIGVDIRKIVAAPPELKEPLAQIGGALKSVDERKP